MVTVKFFTFNPFQQNTYILHDETKECVIIDPGCYDDRERKMMTDYIENEKLKPVKLLNTHCHIDHVFGNKFISDKYSLGLEIHEKDLTVLNSLMQVAHMYQLNAEESAKPAKFLNESDIVKFGNTELDILFTPGHSPGSITFYNTKDKFLIAGDVLFHESIGRSDLPGGDHATLIASIKTKLFTLPDDVKVYAGHMEPTTIGHEKKHNPFLQ